MSIKLIANMGHLMRLACKLGRAKILFQQGCGTEKEYLKARDVHDAYAKICIQADEVQVGSNLK